MRKRSPTSLCGTAFSTWCWAPMMQNPLQPSIFDNAPLYFGITVDNWPEMTPRQRVHAVPWALQAAAIVPGVTLNDVSVNNLTVSGDKGLTVNGLYEHQRLPTEHQRH